MKKVERTLLVKLCRLGKQLPRLAHDGEPALQTSHHPIGMKIPFFADKVNAEPKTPATFL